MEIEKYRVISCYRADQVSRVMFQPQACTDAINIRRANPSSVSCFLLVCCCVPLSDDQIYFDFVLFVIKTVGFRLIYVKTLQKREERKEKSLIITDPVAIGGVNFEAENMEEKLLQEKSREEKTKKKRIIYKLSQVYHLKLLLLLCICLNVFLLCVFLGSPFFCHKLSSLLDVTHHHGWKKNKREAEPPNRRGSENVMEVTQRGVVRKFSGRPRPSRFSASLTVIGLHTLPMSLL